MHCGRPTFYFNRGEGTQLHWTSLGWPGLQKVENPCFTLILIKLVNPSSFKLTIEMCNVKGGWTETWLSGTLDEPTVNDNSLAVSQGVITAGSWLLQLRSWGAWGGGMFHHRLPQQEAGACCRPPVSNVVPVVTSEIMKPCCPCGFLTAES